MCFYNYNMTNAKVAENDIECYKYLMTADNYLVSPFYNMTWEEKETVEASNFDPEPRLNVEFGFHACKSIELCKHYREENEDQHLGIFKFIIPKGSLYFENPTQYLSNKIYLASKEPVEKSYDINDEEIEEPEWKEQD